MPIALAGMHRSGTSMVAHVLKLGGVYFGEEADLFEPTEENPDGYWEHVRFVDLNDEILNKLGGGWESPPPIPTSFAEDARLNGLREKAEDLVEEFNGHEPWAWKDPRNSLTMGLWQEVVPNLGVVVCLRNPLEVTLSLRRRAMFSYTHALELWETYNRQVLEATADGKRIFTDFESYFSRPKTELRRLFAFAEVSPKRSLLDAAGAAVNEHLRHSTFTVRDLLDADVAPEIVELYLALRREGGLRDPARRRPARSPVDGGRLSGPAVDVEALDRTALRQRVKALESIVAVRELELGYVRDRLDSEKRNWQSSQEQSQSLVTERERELADRDRTLAKRERQLGRASGAEKRIEEALRRESRRWEALLRAKEEELARALEETKRLQSLQEGQNKLAGEVAQLAAQLDERVLPDIEAVQSSIYDLQSEADPANAEYRRAVRDVRDAVRENVPRDATVLIASKGDDELLKLYGRQAWHFPRAEDGLYAGYYPQSDISAIAHVETLRAHGAEYLVFPEPALWWLDHYKGLRAHLEGRYERVEGAGNCAIFELRSIRSEARHDWKREFRVLLDEYRLTFGREPSVLDWDTGLELASLFPEHTVFCPPENNGLPYLDGTVDIVALKGTKARPAALEAADRVASSVVLILSGGRRNGYRLDARWKVKRTELPRVSIVIPCHNGIEHTRACLTTLRETLPQGLEAEIIVVDDASTDGTAEFLADVAAQDDRVKIVRNDKNVGFLDSSNRGAGEATGELIVFLNNDTVLLPGWLEPLARTFTEHSDAGAVGGRLLYPDGRLQEAGALVFANGSAWKYGYGDPNATAPFYSFFREVDYCSGGLLATRRSLFADLGGFDTRFRPGFYEDVDYCFALRERGYRVYYEPQSTIVHVEGGTAGTDLSRGAKRSQVTNEAKFARKWRKALREQPERPDGALDGWALAALVTDGREAS